MTEPTAATQHGFLFLKPDAAPIEECEQYIRVYTYTHKVTIVGSGVRTATQMDEDGIIDKHYSAIYKTACLTNPADLVLTTDAKEKFLEGHGVSWESALAVGDVLNMAEAAEELFGDDLEALEAAVKGAKETKLARGLYVTHLDVPAWTRNTKSESSTPLSNDDDDDNDNNNNPLGGAASESDAAAALEAAAESSSSSPAPTAAAAAQNDNNGETRHIAIVNSFYAAMKNMFIAEDKMIKYFVVEFEEGEVSWYDFRKKILGATKPDEADPDSMRGYMYKYWERFKLPRRPEASWNFAHGSASPFEAMLERMTWLGKTIEHDPFGRRLLAAGIKKTIIEELFDNVPIPDPNNDDELTPCFDVFEDRDTSEVIDMIKEYQEAKIGNKDQGCCCVIQ